MSHSCIVSCQSETNTHCTRSSNIGNITARQSVTSLLLWYLNVYHHVHKSPHLSVLKFKPQLSMIPFWANTSLKSLRPSSLFPACLLQPLTPTNSNSSLSTMPSHHFLCFHTYFVLWRFPTRKLFGILSSFICCDICSNFNIIYNT